MAADGQARPVKRKQAAPKAAAPAKRKKSAADSAGPSKPSEPDNSLKGVFTNDIRDIMCAYGDSTNRPVKETVEAVEGVAVEFVRGVITRALEHASIRPKLDEGDIWFVLRKDARKAARGLELLKAKDDAKRYRNVIEQPENINADYVVDMIQVNQDPAAVATGAAAAPVDAAAQPAADAGGYDEGDYVL